MNFIKVLTTICLLVSGFAAQAQDKIVHPDISYAGTPRTVTIAGIAVTGAEGYEDYMLTGISGLTVGQEVELPGDEITNAVKHYWRYGLFSDVSVGVDSLIHDKAYIHIRLRLRPRVSTINYVGVKKSERTDLEERLGLLKGAQITPNMVDRAKILAKKYFDDKGFKNAEIQIVERDDVTSKNHVILDIIIDKKEKMKVRSIIISGNHALKTSKIKGGFLKKGAFAKTHESGKLATFLKAKKFTPERWKTDKQNLIDKYNELGYRDAVIVSDSVWNADDRHVNISLKVDEGKKYYVRNITWVGNTVYTTDFLNASLGMKKGDVYDQKLMKKRLSEDEDAVGNNYWNTGYLFYSLNPTEVNIVGDSIDLEMRIREGQQATFNHVRIAGNTRVYENVIRRELRTKPGDLFSMESIKRSIQDLAQMNQFDPEALQSQFGQSGIKPDPVSGTVDLNYPLTSKGGDQIELSAGWGQTGIVGRVGLKFTNFSVQNLFRKGYKRAGFIPQGDGQTLSLQVQTNGTYYQNYGLSFLEPWLGGKRPNQLSFNISYSKQSDVNSNYINQNYYNNLYNYAYGYGTSSNYYTDAYDPDKYVKMINLSLGFGKRLRWPDDYFTFMAELSYTRYMLKSWQYFLITDGNCNNINLSLSLQRNSTDHPFYPRKGSEFLLQATLTPPYSLWDGRNYKNLATNPQSANYQKEMQEKYRWIEYHKWKLKFRNFTALSSAVKAPVLMTRFEMGILGAYNRHKKSPFETYYVGGDGMSGYSTGYATETIGLRGYENGSLSGNNSYYGDAYAYSRMTLELRYPLMLETSTSIFALAFIEGGNAWTDVKKFNPLNMKRSAGVGVRILLPMVGLMGIDWAYGFQKYISGYTGKRAGGSQFHFIIGQEF